MHHLSRLVLLWSMFGLVAGRAAVAAETDAKGVDFNRDIRPLLSDRCFRCHGPDKKHREAGLRLDERESAVAEADSGEIPIVPGDAEASHLIARLLESDEDLRMPPEESGKKPLTPEQVAMFRRWIDQGAEYQPHWSFRPLARPAAPALKDATYSSNPVDQLVLARLEQRGIAPSPEADRVTLIRRLSFDLTGLPPTQDQVRTFVEDSRPDAYERLVDRLLASPHYGERMASFWLDLVRYADTVGFHGDAPLTYWPYRDWVIGAFNSNMPFVQFTREQLAGDLLPDATIQQKIAASYNRLGMMTAEGGAQAKEYLTIYAADRVQNLSGAWLGATVGCAQCHDHKFDPFTMTDFYSIVAFFADVKEQGVYAGNRFGEMMTIPLPEVQQKSQQIEEEIAALEKQLAAPSTELADEQKAWEAEQLSQAEQSKRTDFVWIDDRETAGGQLSGQWKYVAGDAAPVFSGKFSRRQASDSLEQHFVIGTKKTVRPQASDTLFAYVFLDPKIPPKQIMLQWNDGSWDHRAWWGDDLIPYGTIGADTPAHRKLGPLPKLGEWVRLEVPAEVVGVVDRNLNGIAFTQHGGLAHWDQAGLHTFGGNQLVPELLAIARLEPARRSTEQAKQLEERFRQQAPSLAPLRSELKRLQQEKAELAKANVTMPATVAVPPREIRLLPRGNWMDDSGPVVQPAVPAFLAKLDTGDRRPTRLDLAHWLTAAKNPLTSRALVNRIWKLFFGEGICRSLDDLGAQGQWPSHPELINQLAADLIDDSWDIKQLVRSIVLSRTYRQSSQPRPELAEIDPQNRLLARQSRYRLDAELVRDNALAVSGLLVSQIGGPSVKPYQPAGYYAQLNFPTRTYKADQGEKLYRRGLYTHWQRTFLHPMLLAFDAPSREQCTAQRSRSNTPLQALALLNDPSFVEAGRALAERIVREGGEGDAERVAWAYQQVISRSPDSDIVAALTEIRTKHLAFYGANAAAAKELVQVGARAAPADIDLAELAAWTSVARVLLNLHETITRY